jgi:hypothetical protein
MPENASETPAVQPETPETPAQAPKETDWVAEARKWEQRAKDNMAKLKEAEPIVSQWKALEEASKTETQRAQEEVTRWQTEAQTWRTAAVSSRVETLASADFADPSDALAAIADPAKYLDVGGQINEDAIKADLAALLERKPHWRRNTTAAPVGPRTPAPNPAQGSGVNGTAAADPAQQFAAILRSQMGT